MKKKSRFGTPTAVSPHPKKLPYGLLPFSYTFTFETDPNYTGDYLINFYDKDIPGKTLGGQFANMTASYNQTVDGVDGCGKWTFDASIYQNVEDINFFALRDYEQYGFKWGSLSSFPAKPSEYSRFETKIKYYISRQAPDSGDTQILSTHMNLLGLNSFPSSQSESYYKPPLNQWVEETWTQDTNEYMDARAGVSVQFNASSQDSDGDYFNTTGDFVALKYLTITLIP